MGAERPYPANRFGMPLRPEDVSELPESRLDLSRRDSWNNHHIAFTAREMARSGILQTWRDLEGMQRRMPVDVHRGLHRLFGPPRLPDLLRIMERLERAKMTGEQLKILDQQTRHYVLHEFTDDHWASLKQEYNQMGDVA